MIRSCDNNYKNYLNVQPNYYHIVVWRNGEVRIDGNAKTTQTSTSFQYTLNVSHTDNIEFK